MGERRTLIEGLADAENIDPDLAEAFITNGNPRKAAKTSAHAAEATTPAIEESPAKPPLPQSIVEAAQVSASSPLTGVGRVPMGARIRTMIAETVKRASLERQLQGIQPNSIQEILEESLELWLLKHGYLK